MTIIDKIKEYYYFFITIDNCQSFDTKLYGTLITDNDFYLNVSPGIIDTQAYNGGTYINIVRKNGKLYIQQDYYGGWGMFIYKNGNFWAISNSLYHLKENLKDKYELNINYRFAHHYFFKATTTPTTYKITVINEITEIPPTAEIEIDLNTKHLSIHMCSWQQYYIPIASIEGMSRIDIWHRRYANLLRALSVMPGGVDVDISGGIDSRCALATAKDLLINGSYNIRLCSRKEKEEYAIAKEIAERLGLSLNSYHKPNNSIPVSKLESFLIMLYSKCCLHTQWYINPFVSNETVLRFSGLGGEGLRRYFSEPVDTLIDKFILQTPDNLENFRKDAADILRETVNDIDKTYNEQIHPCAKLWNYTVQRHHSFKSQVNMMLENIIQILPLTDRLLYEINSLSHFNKDPHLIYTVIIDRFIPEINDITFDKERKLHESTWELSKEINRLYPVWKYETKEIKLHIDTIQYIDNDCEESEYLVDRDNCDQWIIEISGNKKIKKWICDKFGNDFYDFSRNKAINHDEAFANGYLIALLSLYFTFNQVNFKNN